MENKNEFEVFQNLWKQQATNAIPDANRIVDKAKTTRSKMTRQILLQVLSLVASSAVIVWVYLAIDFKVITTFIGISCLVATILIYCGIRLYQGYQLQKIDFLATPNEVLPALENYYKFQQTVMTKYTVLYFILINVGMLLYFIEVIAPMVLWGKILVFVVYFSWMFYAYFVLGKKQKQKENAKIADMIQAIKEIETSISE